MVNILIGSWPVFGRQCIEVVMQAGLIEDESWALSPRRGSAQSHPSYQPPQKQLILNWPGLTSCSNF